MSNVGGERVDRAFSLALAALLGNDVYNFGELVCNYCVVCLYMYYKHSFLL